MSFRVCEAFSWEEAQTLLDACPKAKVYYSDGCSAYRELMYPDKARHMVAPGKSQTHNVEGVNSDLRHYLGRLARESRCFTRCKKALECAVRLFQCAYNQRQIWKHEKKLNRVPGLLDCLPPTN